MDNAKTRADKKRKVQPSAQTERNSELMEEDERLPPVSAMGLDLLLIIKKKLAMSLTAADMEASSSLIWGRNMARMLGRDFRSTQKSSKVFH